MRFLSTLTLLLLTWSVTAAEVDSSNLDPADNFNLTPTEDGLAISWNSPAGQAYIEFQVIPQQGNNPAGPLIKEIGIDGRPSISGVDPHYLFYIGQRDLELRDLDDGWMIFFDRVHRRPYGVEKAVLTPELITVSSAGGRATVEFDGLKSQNFSGSLAFILYHDSPFVHMEARVSTERPATAFLYHVGLAKPDTDGHELHWIDSLGAAQTTAIDSSTASVYQTRFRSMALSSDSGSLAISPFPHQYLYPLDFADNFGYNWAGMEYLDMVEGFAFGVRQPPMGDRRFVPWVNAEPGSQQKLGVLLFPSSEPGHENLEVVKSYTRSDTFKPLPGYKTFSSHYHHEHSMDVINKRAAQRVSGIPAGLEKPDFVDFFKRMGVDMVHMAEFHFGRTPGLGTEERLAQLQVMHEEFARLSDDSFLLIPGEEPNVHFGSHWLSMFPNPVNWVLNRNNDQPFQQDMPGYGTVYHVGSAEDVLALLEQEGGLAWTAHPRVKGSTGFPDGYRQERFFTSDRFLGGAWKAMPADYSRDTLGWRVLDLENDMANWGNRKYVLGEVDVFKIFEDYELFGTMNVNYLKLDEIPRYEDGWQPVLDALSSGDFFVTTGEILIPEFFVQNFNSGDVIPPGTDLSRLPIEMRLEWTYPLAYLSIVSGDGNRIYRDNFDLSATTEFGAMPIRIDADLRGRQWVRLEVWDIARNGAFTQPVWIDSGNP
jgi:hypothetical protein